MHHGLELSIEQDGTNSVDVFTYLFVTIILATHGRGNRDDINFSHKFRPSFERVDRNFKTLRLQLIVQLIMKKIKIFTRLFLSSRNLYRYNVSRCLVNKNLGNHKMIESNGKRPGIVAITGRRFGMQENFNIIDNRCMTRLKGDEARCAHEWQFFNTFFSFFFFFFVFSRYMHRRRNTRGWVRVSNFIWNW